MGMVKCIYCQERFDKEKTKHISVSPRRYAHLQCEKPENEFTFEGIMQYSRIILGENANFSKIGKQIKTFVNDGLKYQGIYLTIKYWYEIKKNSTERANGGIGIVPFVYREAEQYWKSVSPKRISKIAETEVKIKYKKRDKIKIGRE